MHLLIFPLKLSFHISDSQSRRSNRIKKRLVTRRENTRESIAIGSSFRFSPLLQIILQA